MSVTWAPTASPARGFAVGGLCSGCQLRLLRLPGPPECAFHVHKRNGLQPSATSSELPRSEIYFFPQGVMWKRRVPASWTNFVNIAVTAWRQTALGPWRVAIRSMLHTLVQNLAACDADVPVEEPPRSGAIGTTLSPSPPSVLGGVGSNSIVGDLQGPARRLASWAAPRFLGATVRTASTAASGPARCLALWAVPRRLGAAALIASSAASGPARCLASWAAPQRLGAAARTQ